MAIIMGAPTPKRVSKSQQFGEAFSRLAQGGTQMALQQEKTKAANEALMRMTGQDLSGLPPEQQQEVVKQFARYSAQKGMLDQLGLSGEFGGQPDRVTERQPSQQGQVDQETGEINVGDVGIKTERMIPDEKIQKMSFINPAVADKMQKHNDNIRAEARHREGIEQKEIASARKETTPIRKQYADQAKFAKEAQKNKEQQLNLIKKGKLDSPERVFFASLLPGALGNKLLSADTQLYRSGLFEEFGVLKAMFPGQIRVKEIELLEDKLASLEKSDEAKQKILETGMSKLEIPKIKAKAAQRVEKEHPKATLLEFEELVDQYAHDDLERAYDNISKTYDKIYFEYAPEKNTLIDKDGHIYKDIPKNLLRSFYEEGNKEGLELRPL